MEPVPDLSDCIVRVGAPEDEEAVRKLFKLVEPETRWSEQYYDWQYTNGPFAHRNRSYLILSGPKVIAHMAAICRPFSGPHGMCEGFIMQEAMTHPDYRGQGLWNRIVTCSTEDLLEQNVYANTFPNPYSLRGFRRTGWRYLCHVPQRSVALATRTPGNKGRVRLTKTIDFDSRIESIWTTAGFRVGTARTSEYLNWRYSKPGGSYYKFYINDDAGFLVTKRFERDGKNVWHILDLVVKRTEIGLLDPVLDASFSLGNDLGAEIVECWLGAEHPYHPAFSRLGLKLDAGVTREAYVLVPKEDSEMVDPRKWHVTQGDSDVY